MSITAVCELHVKPEHQQSVLQTAIDQFARPPAHVAGRRSARLFQQLDEPARLLYVGEWESRAVLDEYRQVMPHPGAPEQYARPPACWHYRRLASFERVLAPVRLMTAVLVTGAIEAHPVRRDLALAYHRAGDHGRAGQSLYELYDSLDEPAGLMILAGWESADALAAASPEHDRALIDQLVAVGGSARHFAGVTVVEVTGT